VDIKKNIAAFGDIALFIGITTNVGEDTLNEEGRVFH
jgi:hypothetical protein